MNSKLQKFPEQMIKATTLAALWDCHVRTIKRAVESGELTGVRVGEGPTSCVMVTVRSANDYVDRHRLSR